MSAAPDVIHPAGLQEALALLRTQPRARVVGGGIEWVSLLRSGVPPPGPLVSVRPLGLDGIVLQQGRLRLGAGTRMAEAARSPLVQQQAPAVAQALAASASPQVRNMATLAGNLLQATRCAYFRGEEPACHRRQPGSGCAVRSGEQRQAAVFGTGGPCCATHASDLAVALLALDAQLLLQSAAGERRLALADLYQEPGTQDATVPLTEHTLAPGELITAIELPCTRAAGGSLYTKVRDRASFQFAVVSLAVALEVQDGRITQARLAAGGVGTVPWRLQASEAALVGQPFGAAAWEAAASAATQGAAPLPGNAFKLDLLRRCVVHTLQRAATHAGCTRMNSTRWEADAKVRGTALYTADEPVPGTLHAAVVPAPVARGRLLGLDTQAAWALPGVVAIYGVGDLPALRPNGFANWLEDDQLHWHGQPVALVVAEDEATARAAAARVGVRAQAEPPVTSLAQASALPFAPAQAARVPTDTQRGEPDAAIAAAEIQLDLRYEIAAQHHQPLEPHACLAHWQGEQLTLYCSTQAVFGTRRVVAHSLALRREQVRVVARHLGGGFGSKGPLWWALSLRVAQAAQRLGRPVLLELTRAQMFTLVGRRSPTRQRLLLGASAEGRVQGLVHDTLAETSPFAEYADPVGAATRWLYPCEHVRTTHRLQRVNGPQAIPMRAPGETPGLFALETALDELAWRCRIDPLALRHRNLAGHDHHTGLPWSSNSLPACWQQAADSFGWHRRPLDPGRLQDGDWLVGWGMANAAYPVQRLACEAEVLLHADGRVGVRCGVQDMGSGSFTALADTVAAVLGVPASAVAVELGDSLLPEGPYSGGTVVTASFVPAVQAAAQALQARRAAGERPAAGAPLCERARTAPPEQASHSACAFGAVFVEARVHRATRELRLARVHAAYAAGRIVSPVMARSQYIGGLVGGIGQTLREATFTDPVSGRIVNGNLGDYLIPVHADMPEFQVHLVPEHDPHLPGGVKGLGMLGTCGTGAAIANAVWHATGQRVRELPIRLEHLLPSGG
ncbi:MAG: molybdopterin-dependent oxidoreductase [Burkholderiales bacterium]|nr:molybdopterin-dependent oxidoreductase [Burkholderiales bacterium]